MSNKMKSETTSSLGYTGIVRLSQYIDNKKFQLAEVRNEGGWPLFNFLADCLVGDFNTAKVDRITKIALLSVDDNDARSMVGPDFIPLLSTPEKIYNEKEGIVKFSFLIPQDYFAGGGVTKNQSVKFNAVGLYTNSTIDIYEHAAFCEVKTDEWEVSLSSILVLDWELHIANS